MLRLAVNGEADVVLPPKNEGGCKVRTLWQFPGGPVVKTWHFPCQGPGSVPGWGTEISQATWCGQKENEIKQLERCVKRIT